MLQMNAQTLTAACSASQKAVFFNNLRTTFAQTSQSLEDAYVEIAERLMELSDNTFKLLNRCTDAVDDGEFTTKGKKLGGLFSWYRG